MSWRARVVISVAALVTWACGRVAVELVSLRDVPPAGAPDAEVDLLLDGGARDAALDPSSDVDADLPASDRDVSTDGGLGTDAASASCDGGPCPIACVFTGRYAVKLALPVSWPGGFVAPGAGTADVWALFTATQSGNDVMGALRPCGLALPDFFLAIGSERYQLRFPDALFDDGAGLPVTPLLVNVAGGTIPGAAFTLPDIGVQIGAALPDAVADPWPALTLNLPLADMDGNGKPGVTGNYVTGRVGAFTYVHPPVNGFATLRADSAYGAARFVLRGVGTILNCGELGGSATFSRFDTRIAGCHVSGGADCSTQQAELLDSNRPVFSPVAGMPASLRVQTLLGPTSCAAVRAALP